MQHLQTAKQKVHNVHDSLHADCHTHVLVRNLKDKMSPVSPTDVLRFRYHHGANLGACFVLEKWLTSSMFAQGADTSELAAVGASFEKNGAAETKRKWETHWANIISDLDLDWLVNIAHCTSIRLPIGYWDLDPACMKGTPFEKFASVYVNAWTAIKKLVSRFRSRGIGTLIDLHALPGGANGGDHSGTNTGRCELWTKPTNTELAQNCLVFLAGEVTKMDGVIGLQLCNEAMWKSPSMYDFYNHVLSSIALIDPGLPIYISDAWNLKEAVNWVQSQNTIKRASNPIIIDTHYYWAFADADKLKSPAMIIAELPSKLSELLAPQGNVVSRGAVQAVVGEYSCTLSESSWSLVSPHDRPRLTIQFGQAQSKQWQARSGGAYFWTLKMDWMEGGGWGFVAQTNTGAITPPPNLILPPMEVQARIGVATGLRASKRTACVAGHVAYWANAAPGKIFEHWRYESGWEIGFADAMAFYGMRASGKMGSIIGAGESTFGIGGDRIGCLEIWVRKRILEGGMDGDFLWEFETGLRQGVRTFEDAVGLS